jgi:hypothetical protein
MPESVAQYAREALAVAPVCVEEREFLEAFLDPPWVIEALAAWALVHCRPLIADENYLAAAYQLKRWADGSGVFHDALGERIRKIFAGVVIMTAAREMIKHKQYARN